MRGCQSLDEVGFGGVEILVASVLTHHDVNTLEIQGLKPVEKTDDCYSAPIPRLPRTMNVAQDSPSILLPRMIESEESYGFKQTPKQTGWAIDEDQNLRRIVRRRNPLGTDRVNMIAIESIKERLRNFLHGISSGEDEEINHQLAHMPYQMRIKPPVIHSRAISQVLAQAEAFQPGPSYFDSDEAHSLTQMRQYVRREKRSIRRVHANEKRKERHERIKAARAVALAKEEEDSE